MSLPDLRCEVAFTSQPGDAVQNWQDVSSYLLLSQSTSRSNGRGDEYSATQAGSCSLTLDNRDGRFTAGYASGAYYPNVKIGRAIRTVIRGSGVGNFVTNSDFETDVSGWSTIGTATISRSNTRAQVGTWSMKIDWAITGSVSGCATVVDGLTIGRTYTASAYVFVPTSGEVVTLIVNGMGLGTNTSTTNAWGRISVTFVATAVSHTVTLSQFSVGGAYSTWVDAVQVEEGSSVVTFSSSAPPLYPRFTGYVDEWPVEWAPGGFLSVASITATDRFKRLGQIGAFSNVVSEEILYDEPSAYFTLGEDAESTTAGDTSAVGLGQLATTQIGSGGTLEFGANTGPGTDGLSAPAFTPVNQANGKYLYGTLSTGVGLTSATIVVDFLTSTAAAQTVFAVRDAYGSYLAIETTAAGKLKGVQYSAFSGVLADLTSAGSVNNGQTHQGAVTVSISAGTVTLEVFIDGVSVGTDTYSGTAFPKYTHAYVGGTDLGQVFTGTISHVASFPTALTAARLLEQWTAASTGFAGESSDERLARYARWAGIADTSFETGSSTSIAQVDTTGLAPLQAMQDVVDTEGGLLFVDGAGVLTLHSRAHRYNAVAAATIATGSYGQDTAFRSNDLLLLNDVTGVREGGIRFRFVDQASIDDFGQYRGEFTYLTTSDNEVIDAVTAAAQRRSQPEPRISALTIDPLTDSTVVTAALSLGLGDLVSLTGLPTQAHASSVDLFIEGVTETISLTEWTVTFNTSPSNGWSVLILDDPAYGVLDAGNRLAY